MKTFIGFEQALELTLSAVQQCGIENLPLEKAVGRWIATAVDSIVDSPSLTTSRKDGFAVISADLDRVSRKSPATLRLIGQIYAGQSNEPPGISSGHAVKITTGAPLPKAANAVIAEEYCECQGNRLICLKSAEPGRNILVRGSDIGRQEPVMASGEKVTPPAVGLLAAAGHTVVEVYRPPRVVVIATGDEVIAPGTRLRAGQLYASNMMEICAWLKVFGITARIEIVGDHKSQIEDVISRHLNTTDAFLTSGGAWGSEKDLMLNVLTDMEWKGIYHRVKMGPGKPVGFGLLKERPFFILPGGPPSNEMAFLQLAVPALMKMMGVMTPVFPVVSARLTADISGAKQWTNFVHARLEQDGGRLITTPIKIRSRLKSMVQKNAIAILPEGTQLLNAGDTIKTQVLNV